MPLFASVTAGVAITVIGTLASVSGLVSRLWVKIIELLEKFLSSETIGMMSVREMKNGYTSIGKPFSDPLWHFRT